MKIIYKVFIAILINKSLALRHIITDNGQATSIMEKDKFFFKMEHISRVLLNRESLMGREDIFTIMAAFIKEKLKIIKLMVPAPIMILFKAISITANGIKTLHMEKQNKNF